jgi:uncharacterized iron-regulated protein
MKKIILPAIMKKISRFLFFILPLFAFKNLDKEPYQLFHGSGKKATYNNMIRELAEADIVLFGELHNSPLAHWLELEIVKDLHRIRNSDLVIGCEMFEADNQLVINEYLKGLINDAKLEENSRLWSNYKTDYKAIVQFAKANNLPFIATNVPRRYASMVYARGLNVLDSLSPEAYPFLPELPMLYDSSVSCYKSLLNTDMGGHASPNLPKAQALKDATMAHFILKNLPEKGIFYHFNGSYHSDRHEGIVWYLKKMKPDLKIKTISFREQKDISQPEEAARKIADYIVVGSENFPKSY